MRTRVVSFKTYGNICCESREILRIRASAHHLALAASIFTTTMTNVSFSCTDSRNHNTNGMADQDPGMWPEVAEISRYILGVRYRYLPYLYFFFHRVGVYSSFLFLSHINQYLLSKLINVSCVTIRHPVFNFCCPFFAI